MTAPLAHLLLAAGTAAVTVGSVRLRGARKHRLSGRVPRQSTERRAWASVACGLALLGARLLLLVT